MAAAPGGASLTTIAVTALVSGMLGYALGQATGSHSAARDEEEVEVVVGGVVGSLPVAPTAATARPLGGKPPRRRVVRLYSAMSCDLYHHGHSDLLKRGIGMLHQLLRDQEPTAAKGEGVHIVMVVGICSDETVESYKRRPIQTLRERAAAMRSCRYCDEVIEDAPAVTDASFMQLHELDYVLTGDDYTDSSLEKWFPEAARRGVCVRAPYTKGISSSDIIRRCQRAEAVVQSNIHVA